MKSVNIVFSINVHENLNFLKKQLDNIKEYVSLEYIVILNANQFMYDEISNSDLLQTNENIILYHEYINKSIYHGSLTKGIFLDMEYAINNYQFEYFIVLSSRNLFYNHLKKENYNNLIKITGGLTLQQLNINEWLWSLFINTELGRYFIENNLVFTPTQYHFHEGLTFDHLSCIKIVEFLNNNESIKSNLFNYNACVEEFALQSISLNFTGYYYQIGNWPIPPYNHDLYRIESLPNDRYVYKTIRI